MLSALDEKNEMPHNAPNRMCKGHIADEAGRACTCEQALLVLADALVLVVGAQAPILGIGGCAVIEDLVPGGDDGVFVVATSCVRSVIPDVGRRGCVSKRCRHLEVLVEALLPDRNL